MTESSILVLVLVFLPFIAALFTPLIHKVLKNKIGWWAVLVAIICLVIAFRLYPEVRANGKIAFSIPWVTSLDIDLSFYVTGLSLLFCVIVSGIGTMITAYANYYLSTKEKLARFYAEILFFMGSMLGVVTSGNLILMFVFWEFTSVSSFLLIGFWDHREASVYGARKALLITSAGALFMLGGLIWLYDIVGHQGAVSIMGSFDIEYLIGKAALIKSHPAYSYILILLLLGAFSKSAQFPFHIWLPNAMEAPTPVSAFLHSATMVKAGVFLVAFLYPVFAGTRLWFYMLTGGGLLTMMMGGYLALKQNDLKALLAYSTIANLGMSMALFGLSTGYSVGVAIFHIMNHAAFKACLFLVVGIIDHETGTRDFRLLSGLRKRMPILAVIAGISSLAMAGVPPFNGFISKEMFFEASLNQHFLENTWLIPLIALVASTLTFVYSIFIYRKVFWGAETTSTPKHFHEAPFGMLLPPMILAAICVVVGLAPALAQESMVKPAIRYLLNGSSTEFFEIHLWHGFKVPVLMSAIKIALGVLICLSCEKVRSFQNKLPDNFINILYDKWIEYQDKLAKFTTGIIQNGYLKFYVMFTVLFMAVMIIGVFFREEGYKMLSDFNARPISLYEWGVAILLIIATFLLLGMTKRVLAIITLSFVGWMVSLLYVIFRAPDLALTQLMIEAISTVLFLLVFRFLPPLKKELETTFVKLRNILVSVVVGGSITLVMLLSNANRMFGSINKYYMDNAYTLAGGKNIVNVIIVDFRGFDTMFEITVLCISAAAIYAMVKFKKKNQEKAFS
ncbi:DUF4040 domain-containing protein [candidate division KSB1 bacterium]|nr:DUF4040 domain-containing protein [candidate division KSB1 bacterium]